MSYDIVKVGDNGRRRIAVYFDETEAIDLANLYGSGDSVYDEIMQAVEQAYPKHDDEETDDERN